MRSNLFKLPLRRKLYDKLQDDNNRIEKEFFESFKQLKLQQLKFQQNNCVPVFLKGGNFDKFLFLTTLGLSGFGLIGTFGFIYNMAYPKKIQHQETAK
jgi:hypothetical protein